MAPIVFRAITLRGRRFQITMDNEATVYELAEQIAKEAEVPIQKVFLRMRGNGKALHEVQNRQIKDVEFLQNKGTNSNYDILVIMLEPGVLPKFPPKINRNNIPCGGKRRKSRRSKKSRKQTRRRR
jgi:hypothetical protein